MSHVTIFKVKRSKVKVTGGGAHYGGLPYSLLFVESVYGK